VLVTEHKGVVEAGKAAQMGGGGGAQDVTQALSTAWVCTLTSQDGGEVANGANGDGSLMSRVTEEVANGTNGDGSLMSIGGGEAVAVGGRTTGGGKTAEPKVRIDDEMAQMERWACDAKDGSCLLRAL